MTRANVLQEVRQMRFEELYDRRQQRAVTMAEAADMLGVTERTFRRWSGRYEADGLEGLQDRRLGRPSGRAVPVDDALRMVTLYETRYTGWTVKHFHERWQAEMAGRGPTPGRRRRCRPPVRWCRPHAAGRIAKNGCGSRCRG
jgi:transposase